MSLTEASLEARTSVGSIHQSRHKTRDEALFGTSVRHGILISSEHVRGRRSFWLVNDGFETGAPASEMLEQFLGSYYHKEEHAYHEVVRSGCRRRLMFDIDFIKGLVIGKELLDRSIKRLQEEVRACMPGKDIDESSFSVAVSDKHAPFKGFHMVLKPFMMPPASIQRIYEAVRSALEKSDAGRALAKCIDPKPCSDTFNMRLLLSGKVMANGERTYISRQKQPYDTETGEIGMTYQEYADYVIQPPEGTEGVEDFEMDLEDVASLTKPRSGTVLQSDEQWEETHVGKAVRACALLDEWIPRGAVHTGENNGKTWYSQFMTYTGTGERKSCKACERVHESRTEYLYLTGEGLVDETRAIRVRCRARAQTEEEKRAGKWDYNVVEVLGTELKYRFSFEGFSGKATKTELTKFLKVQRETHRRSVNKDFNTERKKVDYALIDADLAKAVEHRMQAAKVCLPTSDPIDAAMQELERKGADYEIYGRRAFRTLSKRQYDSEYDLLATLLCNVWAADCSDAAVWNDGQWTPVMWNDGLFQLEREQMRFRVGGGSYGGKDFWKQIVTVYRRYYKSRFMGVPLGRSANWSTAGNVWRMGDAVNPYTGSFSAQDRPAKTEEYAKHAETFARFLRTQIASEGEEYYQYLMGWLASAMQRPDRKIGVALMVRGPMGCGKSLFLSLLNAIVPHASTVTNKGLTTLTQQFNTDIADRTLYMFGEVPESTGLTAQQVAAIKTLITDSVAHIEPKHQTMRTVEQRLNIIVASNMLNSIETSEGDRRWCVLDNQCPVHDKDDEEYWEQIHPLFHDKQFQRVVQDVLLDYNIDEFSPRDYPRSEALQVTRRELPIVDFVLKYPGLAKRVKQYVSDRWQMEGRPATLRDICGYFKVSESQEDRGATLDQLERQLYTAMHNVPQIAELFVLHPEAEQGRMEWGGDVLKYPVFWKTPDEDQAQRAESRTSSAVRDRDAAMLKMVTAMKAAGMDVSEYLLQFPHLSVDDPARFDHMNRQQLRAELKARGIKYGGSDSVAKLRELARVQKTK